MQLRPKTQRLVILALIIALLEILLYYVGVAVDHYYPRNTSTIVIVVVNFLFLLAHFVSPERAK